MALRQNSWRWLGRGGGEACARRPRFQFSVPLAMQARGPRERSTGMGLRGPHAGASTSGARGEAALGPAPINWDFAIPCLRPGGREALVYWVEIHPAHGHGITEVTKKAMWLRGWLSSDGE